MGKKVLKASNVTSYNIGSRRASMGGSEMNNGTKKHKPV